MKITRYITFIFLTALLYACETPMLIDPADVERGIFVTFDPVNTNINSEDIEGTPISGTFDAPASNVASHEITVKRIYDNGESESDFLPVTTITSFPYQFSMDGNELAALFGVPVEETFSNFYEFRGVATGTDGKVATYDNLQDNLVASAEQLQGFKISAAVVCPSDPDVIVGTYTSVTNSTFPDFADPVGGLVSEVSITATANEGFYTISDFTFGTYDHFYAAVGWCPFGDWPGTIQDVCGNFFMVNTFDPWGEVGFGDLTFNPDGTITVVGGTGYGEEWTAVLTKQ
ncbi:MAG: hypothetical protein P1P86_08730 [Bacteroidales bacterium]|nr:hypothetical protein [Bacteroidales bacterium]